MTNILRQGDVVLIPIAAFNDGTIKENNIVAYGEASGHNHVAVGDSKLTTKDGKMYVVTGKEKSFLAHIKEQSFTRAEHHPIPLQPEAFYELVVV